MGDILRECVVHHSPMDYSTGPCWVEMVRLGDEDRRRRWHDMDTDHDQPFEQCASDVCRGGRPVPV